jgi:hypothetical protein
VLCLQSSSFCYSIRVLRLGAKGDVSIYVPKPSILTTSPCHSALTPFLALLPLNHICESSFSDTPKPAMTTDVAAVL